MSRAVNIAVGGSSRTKGENITGWMLTAAALAPLVFFAFYPFFYAIGLSLSVADPGGSSSIGSAHYRDVLSGRSFWNCV